MNFPTDLNEILQRVENVSPVKYGKTRNFLNGDVTYLSPYISRGVISTKEVLKTTLDRGFKPAQIEKFIQELAWRDHWQCNWRAKGRVINSDLRRSQAPVSNYGLTSSILKAETGISAIDRGVNELYDSGYMHNHLRMYTAAIACNMAYNHWLTPAKWMYYHLLDADWASNALSWQWVAGSNANKKYVANQQNVNKYCNTNDSRTFLDVDYAEFTYPTYETRPDSHLAPTLNDYETPDVLTGHTDLKLKTELPPTDLVLEPSKPIYLYNWYNLDSRWTKNKDVNNVLILEPSVFKEYPISNKSIDFMMDLSRNIDHIQVFNGEFADLKKKYPNSEFHFKEHPLNNYSGIEHNRDWMFEISGYHSSFFGFWKKAQKQLRY